MAKRIVIPFADSGDRTVVNDDAQGSGVVNYTEGYGPQYSLDIESNPTARRINRDRNNQLWHDVTSNIQEWQDQVYPDYITTANNDGTPASYGQGVTVNFNGTFRVSLVANNTELPSNNSNWANAFPWPVALGGTGAVSTAGARTNLGLGSSATRDIGAGSSSQVPDIGTGDARYLKISDDLSDVQNVATARTNLGISTTVTGQGSNANGTYRTWSDGRIEQWGVSTQPSGTGAIQDRTFPVAFTDLSTVIITSGTGAISSTGFNGLYTAEIVVNSLTAYRTKVLQLNSAGNLGAPTEAVNLQWYASGF